MSTQVLPPAVRPRTKASKLSVQRSRSRLTILCCLLLTLMTAGLYSRVAGYSFLLVWDDISVIVENPHVNHGLTWDAVSWAFTTISCPTDSYWHPFSVILNAANFSLFGTNAGGHHVTNLLFHVLNVLILFLLLARVTGKHWRSFLVAALFAVHPLNVESVTWISELKNVSCTFFFLLTLAAYGWYSQRPNLKRYLLVFFFCTAAMLSKPMAVTLPAALLLMDFWPLERIALTRETRKARATNAVFPVQRAPLSRLVLEKLPLFALAAALGIITLIAKRQYMAMESYRIESLSFLVRLESAFHTYSVYLWKTFYPMWLSPNMHLPTELPSWQAGLDILVLAGVSAFVWRNRFSRRPFIVGWLWYLVNLLPTNGMIGQPGGLYADRYAYVSLIGIFVVTVWSVCEWADERKLNSKLGTGAVVVIIALSLLTWRQVGYWRDSVTLWSHAATIAPHDPNIPYILGYSLVQIGHFEEALRQLARADKLRPDSYDRRFWLAFTLMKLGRFDESLPYLTSATKLHPDSYTLNHMLGYSLAQLQKFDESLPYLSEAVKQRPDNQDVADRFWLGYTLVRLGRFDEALPHLAEAAKRQPDFYGGRFWLGYTLTKLWRFDEALCEYEAALPLAKTPDDLAMLRSVMDVARNHRVR